MVGRGCARSILRGSRARLAWSAGPSASPLASMWSAQRLLRASLVNSLLMACALALLLSGRRLPFVLFFALALATLSVCGWASSIVRRLRKTAEDHPNADVGPKGAIRVLLYVGELLGLAVFFVSALGTSHLYCGMTVDPATWGNCSVHTYELGGEYFRRVNGAAPLHISAEEYEKDGAYAEAAIAGMFFFFSLMATWTAIAARGYEANMDANNRWRGP